MVLHQIAWWYWQY